MKRSPIPRRSLGTAVSLLAGRSPKQSDEYFAFEKPRDYRAGETAAAYGIKNENGAATEE